MLSAAGVAGPAAVLSWIIASILVGLIALTYAEIGAMIPRSGAIVRYTYLNRLLRPELLRRHVLASLWLITLILATFPLSYYGHYGPLKHPALSFPYGTLVEIGVGIVAYYWGVHSGFATDEIRDIVDTYQARGNIDEAVEDVV